MSHWEAHLRTVRRVAYRGRRNLLWLPGPIPLFVAIGGSAYAVLAMCARKWLSTARSRGRAALQRSARWEVATSAPLAINAEGTIDSGRSALRDCSLLIRCPKGEATRDVRGAVHGDAQPSSQIAELVACPRGELSRQQPEIAIRARTELFDERRRCPLCAQRRTGQTKARVLTE
jgi:hypothetical protein